MADLLVTTTGLGLVSETIWYTPPADAGTLYYATFVDTERSNLADCGAAYGREATEAYVISTGVTVAEILADFCAAAALIWPHLGWGPAPALLTVQVRQVVDGEHRDWCPVGGEDSPLTLAI